MEQNAVCNYFTELRTPSKVDDISLIEISMLRTKEGEEMRVQSLSGDVQFRTK